MNARRLKLREIMGRPEQLEHHLVVLGRAGGAQLECAAASEPLYFAHLNCSDEYALALPTGDPLLDSFQGRTFLSDPATGLDVARLKHGVGDLVLHPYGWLHWPGRLRPPYEPFRFGPGMRPRGLSIVACAQARREPGERPLGITPGREADAGPLGAARAGDVPMLLCDTRRAEAGVVGAVADAVLELVAGPARIEAPRGAYVVTLDADSELIHLPPGEAIEAAGRAIVFQAVDADVEPPPPIWDGPSSLPFPLHEDARPGALPITMGPLSLEATSPVTVVARIAEITAEVPRYWLARHLFRVALHGLRLGYTETYGGFFVDDRDRAGNPGGQTVSLGLRGASARVTLGRDDALWAIERIYRAVAPPSYTERLAG